MRKPFENHTFMIFDGFRLIGQECAPENLVDMLLSGQYTNRLDIMPIFGTYRCAFLLCKNKAVAVLQQLLN